MWYYWERSCGGIQGLVRGTCVLGYRTLYWYLCVSVCVISLPISYYIKGPPDQTTSTVPAPYLPKPKVHLQPPAHHTPKQHPHHTVFAGIKPIPAPNFSPPPPPPPLQYLPRLIMRGTSFYSRHIRLTSGTVTIVQKFPIIMPAKLEETKYHLATGGPIPISKSAV